MALKATRVGTNGSGRRKLESWIDSFIAYTDNLESAEVFRKWTAITCIAAALEQRVWITTSDQLFPNLYTILVGHPGVGKTRTIMSGRKFLAELPEFHIAPTSMKMASLVDSLLAAKRVIVRLPQDALEFHSMTLCVDEWTAFMHAFDDELVGGLTTFYDVVVPYEQHRRGKDIRIKIPRPQLSILAGSTPSNLIKFMPEGAWDQGFTSRIILVYSNERFVGDDFAISRRDLPEEMIYDLKIINSLQGEFTVTKEFQGAVNGWRKQGEGPRPSHPKLLHYNTRRRTHLYKLAMVSAIDRGNDLSLTGGDFHRALEWLGEAEINMPAIFEEGTSSVDGRAMDEIADFIRQRGKVHKQRVLHFITTRAPAHAVTKIFDLMVHSGRMDFDAESGMVTPHKES